MKELTYLLKDIKDREDSFWYKFLDDINRNKFVIEDILENVFKFFKFNCDICVVESNISYEKFKCIYKSEESIDENLWLLMKRNILIDVAHKNQLQNISLNKKNKKTRDTIKEFYYILPIKCKNSIYYIIFNRFDSKYKHKYVLAFEALYCVFQTCEKNDLLAQQSMVDSITGCYNFNQFQKSLGAEIAKIDRVADKDVIFSVTLMDIDGFGKINEAYGYTCGDIVLKTVSKAIREKIRNTDDAYRIGGDEFCVINTYATKEICQEYILPRISEEVCKKIELKEGVQYMPSLNVAIVQYKKGMTRSEFENLMQESLLKAKQTGKLVLV